MNSSTVFIIILLLVAGYGTYEFLRFSNLVKKGRALAAEARAFSLDEGRNKTILVVGDSTAVGVGSTPEDSVAGRLAVVLNADVENRAESGAVISDVINQISASSNDTYDLVLIHAGANDVIQRTPLDAVRRNVAELLEHAQNKGDHIALLTAGDIGDAPIWPLPLSLYVSDRTRKVRDIVKTEVESAGALYIDIYAHDMGFREDPERYYASDYLHLSGEGYHAWFEFILTEIQKRWPSEYGQR